MPYKPCSNEMEDCTLRVSVSLYNQAIRLMIIGNNGHNLQIFRNKLQSHVNASSFKHNFMLNYKNQTGHVQQARPPTQPTYLQLFYPSYLNLNTQLPKSQFFSPKLLHCLFTFSSRTFCENFSPNGPKFPKRHIWTFPAYLSISRRIWAVSAGVDIFSAQNCYIAYLLFDYAHSVKFSARMDQN